MSLTVDLINATNVKADYPFTTDGCSGGMTWAFRLVFRRDPPWESLCITHDSHYWRGGTRAQRKAADAELLAAVAERGYPLTAILMYLAVRVGGHAWLPLPWRWGYGWKYPRAYQ